MIVGETLTRTALDGKEWAYKVMEVKDDGSFLISFGNNPDMPLGWHKSLEEFHASK